ncbi:hypothetical protein KJ996_03960 [Patescibacteria group bacterium]|nr:hypothetical protein [Patescibacteria group bacterium]
MKILSISTGLASLLTMLPFAAQAAPYCGERVCHSYDSNGACNNYTCFGDGYRYGDPYYPSASRGSYYGDYYRGSGYTNDLRYPTRYYNNSYYNDGQTYDSRYYRDSSYYGTRRYNRAYYYDDYYTGYNDRIYVPKAGYYYRY